MMQYKEKSRQSTLTIERLYISLRYIFNRGFYNPNSNLGKAFKQLLLSLNPEIYGSMAESDRVELYGLEYVMDRLPDGIEQCPFVNLTADEGYGKSHLSVIIPKKRRRNCYRIDDLQMNIEITRGKSDIYDILTHMTFLYIEADKMTQRIWRDSDKHLIRSWKIVSSAATSNKHISERDKAVALTHLSNLLGRTYEETLSTYKHFQEEKNPDRFFKMIYHLVRVAKEDFENKTQREISFSLNLRECIGQHIHGKIWAKNIKKQLNKHGFIDKPIHIISANMHSVMNMLYGFLALQEKAKQDNTLFYKELSLEKNKMLSDKILKYAQKNGLTYIKDNSGSNIDVQIIDLSVLPLKETPFKLLENKEKIGSIIVMDYAFGEQAFEVMDELLKPFEQGNKKKKLKVKSISIMGKAGILEGNKGDVMIPHTHLFEGSADNYPFKNELTANDFKDHDLPVYTGSMVTVLGTSLQNRDLLYYFKHSSWQAIGIEMEGAHYQKAIQSASRVRNHIESNVKLLYAYYASDNPLISGSTLASGGLGIVGVQPTYAITEEILKYIFTHF